ncbi:MAG: delta-aminolevulinic acid dehydratase [Phycisphaerae bacterium]|mgnify:CR=1 FL=1|nr:MAG: delta-aminolevulinic acid dehydratase [Phycisphaerae bacterium]
MDYSIRPRRLRGNSTLRTLLQRVRLNRSDIIVPVFVCEGTRVRREVTSMPGVYQMSVDVAVDWLKQMSQIGFGAYIAFGVIDRTKKDALGTEACNPDNVICQMLRRVKDSGNPMVGITDLCLCEYTDHGHCGPLTADSKTVDNDNTLSVLARQAVNHARAGADIVAPSGMMDGMVRAIRTGLDEAGWKDVSILSYAVKYASAYYGPFRDAADSAPTHGDRRSYQMDYTRGVEEALLEVDLDIQQGADMVMVKPAGVYLDILAAVRQRVHVPVVAYQVSGEYAQIKAASERGWLNESAMILESLTAIKRAGADLIISYFAPQLVDLLD